jgi:hypothetical protein
VSKRCAQCLLRLQQPPPERKFLMMRSCTPHALIAPMPLRRLPPLARAVKASPMCGSLRGSGTHTLWPRVCGWRCSFVLRTKNSILVPTRSAKQIGPVCVCARARALQPSSLCVCVSWNRGTTTAIILVCRVERVLQYRASLPLHYQAIGCCTCLLSVSQHNRHFSTDPHSSALRRCAAHAVRT